MLLVWIQAVLVLPIIPWVVTMSNTAQVEPKSGRVEAPAVKNQVERFSNVARLAK